MTPNCPGWLSAPVDRSDKDQRIRRSDQCWRGLRSPAAASTNGLAGLYADMYSAGLTEEAAVQHYLRELGYTVTESKQYATEYVQKLDGDALREFLYDSLGEEGKSFVSRVQRRNRKSGAEGLTSGDQQVLEDYVADGQITMEDLSIILTLFGNWRKGGS